MGAQQEYHAGLIDYPTYFARAREEKRAIEQAAKMDALSQAAATGSYDPRLIASEQALAQASYQQAQQQAAQRDEIARQQAAQAAAQKKQQDALLQQQREQQAADNARIAAGVANAAAQAAAQAATLKKQQQQLAAAQAAERIAATAAAQAVAAEQAAVSARVSELTEAARQEMLEETGRVVAPELEGSVIAAAMEYAQAESDYNLGLRDTRIPDTFIDYGLQQSLMDDLYMTDEGHGGGAHSAIERTYPPPAGTSDESDGSTAGSDGSTAGSDGSTAGSDGSTTGGSSSSYGLEEDTDGAFLQEIQDALRSILDLFVTVDTDEGTPPTLTQDETGGLAELFSPGRLLLLAALGLFTGVWLTT